MFARQIYIAHDKANVLAIMWALQSHTLMKYTFHS